MDIKDLVGLSEPLTRLIEVISKGVGEVTAPYLTRKNADAKAYEIRVIGNSLNEVARQNHLPIVYKDGSVEVSLNPEDQTLSLEPKALDDRSNRRLDYQARKGQANIESVTTTAAIELATEESISPESPDDDWVTRFFKFAQDVSSEEMQDLWGRILAGEIRRHGTFSLRTLDFVRNLTRAEAQLMERVGKLALSFSGAYFVSAHDKKWLETDRGIHQSIHFELAELDLMFPTELAVRVFRDGVEKEHFLSGDRILIVERGEIKSEIQLKCWKFTAIGAELLPLVPPQTDDLYLENLGHFFIRSKAKAYLADITSRNSDGSVGYNIVREINIPDSTQKPAT